MAVNSLENIQMRLPRFYDKYNDKSVLYGVVNAFSGVDAERNALIDRIDGAIGIDTTYDEDLQYRWGSLLSMNRKSDESYTAYRNRLKMAYPSLVGGTASAIKYAISSVIGVTNDQNLVDNYVHIYDAWEYDGLISIDPDIKEYGNILCIIDLTIGQGAFDMEQEILSAINIVKASGVKPHIMYIGIKILSYRDMSRFDYSSLSTLSYDELIN